MSETRDFLPTDTDLDEKFNAVIRDHFDGRRIDSMDVIASAVKMASDVLSDHPDPQKREAAVEFTLQMLAQKSGYTAKIAIKPKARKH